MVPGDVSGYRIPFQTGRKVTIEQGWNDPYSHTGKSRFAYDFGVRMWTPVVASAAGVVAFTRTGNRKCGGEEMRKYANLVTINHADGSATQYGHLSTVSVKVGQVVKAGQVIGRSGKTGYTNCQPHLHFARQLQGRAVTRSIPIYFQGYEKKRLHSGDVVQAKSTCRARLADATEGDEATETFCGTYYKGKFKGSSLFSRKDGQIDLDLEKEGPGGYWLDKARPFSVRWAGRFEFAPWWYTFRIEATGGVRVIVDGVVLVDAWDDSDQTRVFEFRQRMRAGVRAIEVEHYTKHKNDRVKVDWIPFLIDS